MLTPPSPYSDPSKATASKGVLSHLEKAKEGDENTFDLIEKQFEEQKDICSENAKVYEKLEDLKDEKGRRATGGKLEVYVHLREPLSGCDQEEKEQKRLVFQEAIASEPTVSMVRPTVSTGPASSLIKVEQTTSLDALKLEFSLVQKPSKQVRRILLLFSVVVPYSLRFKRLSKDFKVTLDSDESTCWPLAGK
uniref:Uncharacterized protein n=1 Tax=Amphimedon queenslandica TaxID=400682 RepID=A0A1X7VAP4_AMPQE